MKKTRLGALMLAAGLLLAACGTESNSDATATDEQSPETSKESPTESTSNQVLGLVTVDGVNYDITTLRNCNPPEDGPVDRELELQGLGEHEGSRIQIDVYIQTFGGMPHDDVSWAGPEGIFGGPEDAQVALNDDGTRVSGTATLVDAMNQTDTVAINFDLEVPTETIDCR